MNEKPRKSWKRRTVSLVLCLCTTWMIYVEAMNLIPWYFARETSLGGRNLDILPTKLSSTNAEELMGFRIEKFGFSFQVPWKEIERDRTSTTLAAIAFKEGGALLIFNPISGVDAVKTLRGSTEREYRVMTKVLGPKALTSNYELMAAELQVAPVDVKWWAGRIWNTRNLVLLNLKETNIGEVKAVHPIDFNGMRGFQYGDPDVAPFVVHLQLFDNADRHYELIIKGKDSHHAVISQVQINGIVASFRPIPPRPGSSLPSNGE